MLKLFFTSLILFHLSSALAQSLTEAPLVKEANVYNNLMNTPYSLFIHQRNYILPAVYNWAVHDEIYSSLPGFVNKDRKYYTNIEAEFQISFFVPIYRNIFLSGWDILAAYTHHSWWQLYNSAWSKPFRETNYKPELFIRKIDNHPLRISHFKLAAYDIGYVHQSNGQIHLLSRGWNRAYVRTYLLNEEVSMSLEAWIRLPEKDGEDDNTDILTYMGLGEMTLHKSMGSHSLEVKFPLAAKPGIELMYSYPWHEHLRWFVTGRSGYGHSLVEYNLKTERLGIGITLESLMDTNNNIKAETKPK